MHQIRAVALHSYIEVADSLGIDGRRLLAEEGIPASALDDPEKHLPAVAAIRLLERSAELSRVDSFGIRMAQCRSFASLGAISLLLERLSTVGDVLSALGVLRGSLSNVLFVAVEHSGECVSATFDVVAPHSQSQAADLTVALGYVALVGASRGQWSPECVHFIHSEPRDRVAFERFFKSPLSFDDSFNGMSFSRQSLETPLPLADPAMALNAQRLLSLMPLHEAGDSVSDRASRAISLLLPVDKATIENVSMSMNKSVRALQRELRGEGQTFTKILNDTRRNLARQYMTSSSKKLVSVSETLGYSSAGSFTRWFHREFGSSPSKWRKLQATSAPLDEGGVIFSLKDGEVWANRQDGRPLANLGPHDAVVAMMVDYLRQTDAAERLLRG